MAPSRTSSTMGGALSIVLAAAACVNASTPPLTLAGVPTCNPGFQWAFNSLGQSPCRIASSLGAACLTPGRNFPIPRLKPPHKYSGPPVGQTTACRCSSVYYSVLSACALCQGASISLWAEYNQNCPTPFLTVFEPAIPSGVTVPHYAYLDVSAGNGKFNATLAQNAGGLESSAVPQPTACTSPAASTHKKFHAGAIAGGVVNVERVVGLLLVAFLGHSLLRMRNRRQAPEPILDDPQSENGTMLRDGKVYPYEANLKLCDPNDPKSLPATMPRLAGGSHSTPSQGRHQSLGV